MSAVLSTTPKKDHTWDNGVVTTEPTAEKDGVKTYPKIIDALDDCKELIKKMT